MVGFLHDSYWRGISLAGLKHDGRSVAAQLLAAVPCCLLDLGAIQDRRKLRLSEHSAVAQHLTHLMDGCLRGDAGAVKSARRIVARCTAPSNAGIRTSAAWDLFYRTVESHETSALTKFVLDEHARYFEDLPLVARLRDEFPVPSDSPLAAADILACRHLMASTVAELRSIRELLPRATFVEILGKPYSANRLVMHQLEMDGFNVNRASCEWPENAGSELGLFAGRQRELARAAVRRYVEHRHDPVRPLLVIDDGGALIDAVRQQVLDGRIRCPVVAIEQTSHGTHAAVDRRFFRSDLARERGFAVVSVADSQAKLEIEASLIAKSVLTEAGSWLNALPSLGVRWTDGLRQSKVGIIGIGVLGAAVLKQFSSGASDGTTARLADREPVASEAPQYEVAVYDRNRHKNAVIGTFGEDNVSVAWSLKNLLGYAQVIISASGGTAINAEAALSLRPDTVLMSASSGDFEFRGLNSWRTELVPLLGRGSRVLPFDRAHGLLVLRNGGNTVYVVNRGFPVNFDGSLDPISRLDIQLTRGLIAGGVMQAAGVPAFGGRSLVGQTGIYELSPEIDGFFFKRLGDPARL